jgi:hypothetical protein
MIMDNFDYQGLTPKRVFPETMNVELIGKEAMYKCDWRDINVQYEHGTITSYNDMYIFIDFVGNGHGQACRYNNVLLAPTITAPHICKI